MNDTLADQLSRLIVGENSEKPEIETKHKKKKHFPIIQNDQLTKGTIIYVPLSEEEGLILKDGYKKRDKFIVVMGLTADGYVVGSLLINSNPNDSTVELGACQFPLKRKDYPTILDYDSWLDCSELFRVNRDKVLGKGGYCGMVTDKDWALVLPFLIENPLISNKDKKEFGII